MADDFTIEDAKTKRELVLSSAVQSQLTNMWVGVTSDLIISITDPRMSSYMGYADDHIVGKPLSYILGDMPAHMPHDLHDQKIVEFMESGRKGRWLHGPSMLRCAEDREVKCAVQIFTVSDVLCLGICDINDMRDAQIYGIAEIMPFDRLSPWMMQQLMHYSDKQDIFDGIVSGRYVAVPALGGADEGDFSSDTDIISWEEGNTDGLD